MTKAPLIIGGKRIGKVRASFLLLMESIRFLRADTEMLFVPIIALVVQCFLFGLIAITVIIPSGMFANVTAETNRALLPQEYGYIFLFYVVSAFVVACSQATITHIVYTRAHGGDATLGQGLSMISKHFGPLLLWAVIASTVGMVLRMIAERSQLLVKLFVFIAGTAWSVLTYFVVPAIVIDNKPTFAAISHSGSVFKRTWGETLVSNVSLSLAFMIMFVVLTVALVGGIFITGGHVGSLLVSVVIFVTALLIVGVLSSVLDSVLRTLLYVYASEGITPTNFNSELLNSMLVIKTPVATAPVATTV